MCNSADCKNCQYQNVLHYCLLMPQHPLLALVMLLLSSKLINEVKPPLVEIGCKTDSIGYGKFIVFCCMSSF